jgi:hypothetical protein
LDIFAFGLSITVELKHLLVIDLASWVHSDFVLELED